CARVANWDVW
nr:immunoglobulin heavy chain junction region [Mus musculus]